MIEISRINGTRFFVNPDMILTVESTPDTVISMSNGDKLVVKESPQEIAELYIACKRRIYHQGLGGQSSGL